MTWYHRNYRLMYQIMTWSYWRQTAVSSVKPQCFYSCVFVCECVWMRALSSTAVKWCGFALIALLGSAVFCFFHNTHTLITTIKNFVSSLFLISVFSSSVNNLMRNYEDELVEFVNESLNMYILSMNKFFQEKNLSSCHLDSLTWKPILTVLFLTSQKM